MLTKPTRFPLVFSFREMIAGDGFIAGVEIGNGRALAERDDEGSYWVFGVEPGGVADTGGDLQSAFCAFRERIRLALVDAAAGAASFDGFQHEALALLSAVEAITEAEWEVARASVRDGSVSHPGLPKDASPGKASFRVVELRRPTVSDNATETTEPSLAA